jgi:heme exporter protein C
VIRLSGPTIDPSMLWPLLVMAVGASLLFITLHLMGMRNEILRRRVRTLGLLAAQRDETATGLADAELSR